MRFDINDQGDVIRASSPSRPYDVPDGFAEAPWYYEFSDHQDYNGVRIPAAAVATYDKEEGPGSTSGAGLPQSPSEKLHLERLN